MQDFKVLKIIENSFLNLQTNYKLAFDVLLRAMPLMILLDLLAFLWLGPTPTEEILKQNMDKILPILLISFLGTIIWIQMIWSWHRVYLISPDSSETKFTPLKMTYEQFQFMMKGVLLWLIVGVVLVAGTAILGLFMTKMMRVSGESQLAQIITVAIFFIGLISLLIAVILVSTRMSLYFPAKAAGDYISFRRSYTMMRSLAWKLLLADFLTLFAIQMVGVIYLNIIPDISKELTDPLSLRLTQYTMDMPARVIFSGIAGLVCVSNLSQTYNWVKRNRYRE